MNFFNFYASQSLLLFGAVIELVSFAPRLSCLANGTNFLPQSNHGISRFSNTEDTLCPATVASTTGVLVPIALITPRFFVLSLCLGLSIARNIDLIVTDTQRNEN